LGPHLLIVTSTFGAAVRSKRLAQLLLAVAAVATLLAVGVFVIDAAGTTPEPVPFDQTIKTGMSSEQQQVLLAENATIPRAEVFHSQYQFVVGYHGVGHMIDELQQPGTVQQYGRPVAVYVSNYAGTDVSLSPEGYPQTATKPDWVRAPNAVFVVNSDARRPGGDAVLPFRSRGAAESFVDEHGGSVLDWATIQTREMDIDHAEVVRGQVETKHAAGDDRVEAVRPLLDREELIVVGEDAPTIQAAIDAADRGTTVRVPPGTYEETLSIDHSLTLDGPGATVRGDGNGSVITVTGDDVAIRGLAIEGVGNSTEPEEDEVDDENWDAFVEAGYGHSDAAIEAENVSNLYVRDVEIETPASGIVLRDVDGTVVERTAVQGHETPREGFMGVLSIRSPVVVQNSTFEDGRDAIYLHRAGGSVIRNNTFVANRFGVHLMYTSETLIADNVATGQRGAGITIMTEPTNNAVVGNEVRNASSGLDVSGTFSYIGENTFVGNDRGLMTGSEQSLYERNVLYKNDLGVRTGTIRPSNRIVRNDFVKNEKTVKIGTGPLRIWTHDGSGNYWSKRPAGVRTDSYSPTASLDSSLHDTDGAISLSASPAATALETVRNTVAGTREGEVLDTAPRAEPVRPQTIDELERTYDD
jgi:parallel beta-helix repeat protein